MSVKILNLLPVTGDVLTPEMFKYMCKYLESDTEVQTYQITSILPLSNVSMMKLWLRRCLEVGQAGRRRWLSGNLHHNCFGDPAVKAAREFVDIPVFGWPATHFALTCRIIFPS